MKSSGIISLKSNKEIDIMHDANCIVHEVLNIVGDEITPGVSTGDIDRIAEEYLRKSEATSAFKNYRGFPKVICISVNEEVVHGIPDDNRIIEDGDVVSVDFGVYYKGYAGDSAKTFIVGETSDEIGLLSKNTRESLFAGIDQMYPGNYLYDINKAIAKVAEDGGYGNLKNFCGHGIGKSMHEAPHVFNWINTSEQNILLREGMVFALEPMFTLGSGDVTTLDDNWTIVTSDKSIAAHWELSIAITKGGPRVLGTEKN